MTISNVIQRKNVTTSIILMGLWFGLFAGLIEGLLFLTLQKIGRIMHVWYEIVWISPIFEMLLFLVVGILLVVIYRLFPRIPIMPISTFLFAFLAFLDWLVLGLRSSLHPIAILILAAGLATETTRQMLKRKKKIFLYFRRTIMPGMALVLLIFFALKGAFWMQKRTAYANVPQPSPGSPNILLIVIDTLRADHLSSYGYSRPTSPNIDRFAKEGVLFENAFSTSSYTLPSHASLLTGHYTTDHGVEWDTSKAFFENPYPTLAEALYSRGYRTGAFSANTLWFTREYGFGRGFIHFDDFFHSVTDMVFRTVYGRLFEKFVFRTLNYEDIPARKRPSHINLALLRWIDLNRQKPFFAMLNYMDTHDPYLPPHHYRSRFSHSENIGGLLNCGVGRCDPDMSPGQLQSEIDAYDAAIAFVDERIGQLVSELDRRGLDKNTLLIITSDHGEAFGEHDLLLHDNSLYREVIHVPLVLRYLAKIPAELRFSQPVTNAALPATIMALIAYEDQKLFPGPPLTHLWSNKTAYIKWPYPMAEMKHKPWTLKKYPVAHSSLRSIITPKWHFIVNGNMDFEIYDWKQDPLETNNMAKRPELKELISRLSFQLGSTSVSSQTF